MSRDMRDISPGTYVLRPDTSARILAVVGTWSLRLPQSFGPMNESSSATDARLATDM
jgi:hypothetical protein